MPAVVTTIKALTTLFATRSDGVGTAIPTIDVVITLTPARTVADETKTGSSPPSLPISQSQVNGETFAVTERITATVSGISILTLLTTASDSVATIHPGTGLTATLGPISIPQATGTSQAHVVPSASGFKYLGCYTEADNRALAGASFPDDSNTVKKCAANCARFKYAGVEYGRECYCSDTLKSGSTAASENECNMACVTDPQCSKGGNSLELCGGSVRLNVYIREEDWSSPSVTSPATLTIESAATPSLSTSPGMSLSATALAISPPLPATPSSAQVTSTINLSSAPENPTSVIVNHDTTATRTSFVTTTHTFTTTRSNAPIQTSSPLSSSPDFARTTAWSSYLSDTYPVLSRPTIPIPIFTPNSLMCLSTNATQHPADTATPPATSLSSVSVSVSVSVPPSSALPSPSPKSTPASPGSAAPPATNNASITSTSATNNASTVRITTIRRPGPGLGPSGTRSTASPGPVSRDLQGRRAGALLVCVVAVMMVFAF
ncbi:WSC domain containing protein [Drepanopeziza brunnea f. sp. 'multigermtubi' MB_m1]|uniref:WSC domain containing protein n=1 Tax=Marssonina brunnea f. sp. multigermtubi (strain MB_m1) TaxID=1072389 RepID=K1XC71_MARBU|nr:WSC domain containing protein [Drepanopeziza brunnea f. sp. 'multigermtubi' MB_m1]EKD18373.1 WSC domain containing protein [Drepanopeziza brunnea f. sp. 'multigermtubi' MB_m1]